MIEVVGFIIAMFAGALGHEVAHWAVWTATGRQPRLHWRDLYVEPRAGPAMTTLGDRLAAAAPYLIGVLAISTGLLTSQPLVWVFGVGFVFNPSRADWEAIRGTAKWDVG